MSGRAGRPRSSFHTRPRQAAGRLRPPAGGSGSSMPSASSTSCTDVTGTAPVAQQLVRRPRRATSRRAGHGQHVAAERQRVVGRDQRARAGSRASTTSVASASAAMMRLRTGKRQGAGSTPGAHSETTAPLGGDCLRPAPRCAAGRGGRCRSRARRPCARRRRARRRGPPRRCRSASPLTTATPARPGRRPSAPRRSRSPAVVGTRACPTIATTATRTARRAAARRADPQLASGSVDRGGAGAAGQPGASARAGGASGSSHGSRRAPRSGRAPRPRAPRPIASRRRGRRTVRATRSSRT